MSFSLKFDIPFFLSFFLSFTWNRFSLPKQKKTRNNTVGFELITIVFNVKSIYTFKLKLIQCLCVPTKWQLHLFGIEKLFKSYEKHQQNRTKQNTSRIDFGDDERKNKKKKRQWWRLQLLGKQWHERKKNEKEKKRIKNYSLYRIYRW